MGPFWIFVLFLFVLFLFGSALDYIAKNFNSMISSIILIYLIFLLFNWILKHLKLLRPYEILLKNILTEKKFNQNENIVTLFSPFLPMLFFFGIGSYFYYLKNIEIDFGNLILYTYIIFISLGFILIPINLSIQRFILKFYFRRCRKIYSADFNLVRSFVKKYYNKSNYELQFIEFYELLRAKGYKVSQNSVHHLLEYDYIALLQESFENKVKEFINDKEKVMGYFLTNSSSDKRYEIVLMNILKLNRKGYKKLKKDISKKIKLENFEKNLLSSSNNKEFSLTNVDYLSGYEFEDFLNDLFNKMNYVVNQTKLSGDQGADLVVERLGIKTAIQAKRSKNSVGNKAVQEVVASRNFYDAQNAIVITNNYFTKGAKELASKNDVELWDRHKLKELVDDFY